MGTLVGKMKFVWVVRIPLENEKDAREYIRNLPEDLRYRATYERVDVQEG